jgi:hypothetical protein
MNRRGFLASMLAAAAAPAIVRAASLMPVRPLGLILPGDEEWSASGMRLLAQDFAESAVDYRRAVDAAIRMFAADGRLLAEAKIARRPWNLDRTLDLSTGPLDVICAGQIAYSELHHPEVDGGKVLRFSGLMSQPCVVPGDTITLQGLSLHRD